jgi:hypothetical protein
MQIVSKRGSAGSVAAGGSAAGVFAVVGLETGCGVASPRKGRRLQAIEAAPNRAASQPN